MHNKHLADSDFTLWWTRWVGLEENDVTNAIKAIAKQAWFASASKYQFPPCAVCNEESDGPYYCPEHKGY